MRAIFRGELKSGKKAIKAKLELYLFKEEEAYIVYCPALDLSAYGSSAKEAKESFAQTFKMHIDYCINKNTLVKDLVNHGWNIKSLNQRKIQAPSFDKLFKMNESFRELTRKKDYTKYSQEVGIPEFA